MTDTASGLGQLLQDSIQRLQPKQVVATRPGEWRVLEMLVRLPPSGVSLDLQEDRHFYTTPAEFAAHADGRKGLRMEFFYRSRRRYDV